MRGKKNINVWKWWHAVVIKTPFEQVEESIQDHTFHGRWESAWEAYVQCRTNPEVLASLPPLHPECPSTVAVGSLDHLHESFSLKTYSALLRSCHKAMKLQESWFVFATARDTHTVQLDIEFYHQMMDVFRDFEMEKVRLHFHSPNTTAHKSNGRLVLERVHRMSFSCTMTSRDKNRTQSRR